MALFYPYVMTGNIDADAYRAQIEDKSDDELNDLADDLFDKHANAAGNDAAQKELMTKLRVVDDVLMGRNNA